MFNSLILSLALAHSADDFVAASAPPSDPHLVEAQGSATLAMAPASPESRDVTDAGDEQEMAGGPDEARRQARTPMGYAEARLHLDLAYHAVVGQTPSVRTLSLLLAQWALETGRGANMWGFNFGGLKSSVGGANLETRESFGRGMQLVTQRFRTYRSALEGARDYIETLERNFPDAFQALHAGSAADFVQALSASKYFTGNPAEYSQAITRLALEFERTL